MLVFLLNFFVLCKTVLGNNNSAYFFQKEPHFFFKSCKKSNKYPDYGILWERYLQYLYCIKQNNKV